MIAVEIAFHIVALLIIIRVDYQMDEYLPAQFALIAEINGVDRIQVAIVKW